MEKEIIKCTYENVREYLLMISDCVNNGENVMGVRFDIMQEVNKPLGLAPLEKLKQLH